MNWQSEAVMKLFKSGNGTSSAIDKSRSVSSHKGAIIGGAVGGTVAVALLALGFLLVRRRRSKSQWAAAQQQKATTTVPSENHHHPHSPAPTHNSYKYQPYAPSSASPGFYEAPSDTSPMELPVHYRQPTTATPPQGQHPGQGTPVVHPHGHSSQQPGRQSHFYEMP